ncbi:MAG: glutamine--fructose-6-phosphate transaminase (isomerizing) [Parcubacteria group bacterium]|nr:glutamine--fructose-6-phosphate transaminase (isomerizing) [Parcubacteria group bacterium]
MCGIIGYVGKKQALPIVINGLKRLEYRGYDSAGVALINDKMELQGYKKKGRSIEDLKTVQENGTIGIGHTRWATHGVPSDENAHPHFDCLKNIAVAHNGIIENYRILKKFLEKDGHRFVSQTDTEIIPHLLEYTITHSEAETSFKHILAQTLKLVQGTYGLAILYRLEPNKIFVACSGSPVIIGIINNDEYIVASDQAAIVEHTKNIIYMKDGEIAVLEREKELIIEDLNEITAPKNIEQIVLQLDQIEKGGYAHFMLKEIFEQPNAMKDAMRGRVSDNAIRLGGISEHINFLQHASEFVISACGTSWHAGFIGQYLFENLLNVSCKLEYASEFRYKKNYINPLLPYFVISQSGETADTLEAVKRIKRAGAKTFGIVNVVGSSIARETNAGIYLHAGPEIGVASTKAFTSQVTVLTMLTLFLAKEKGILNDDELSQELQAIKRIPQQAQYLLDYSEKIKEIARKYYQVNNFLYLGRGYNFPVALEGALKLKEISYIHAEGYPAAEMKHGPIALIDENMPVVVIATDTEDVIYQKVVSNIEEIKSRNGKIIAVATEGNENIQELAEDVIYVPKTRDYLSPLLNVIPLQLLAYYIAVLRGCDVDKPRNLAKSVTVE